MSGLSQPRAGIAPLAAAQSSDISWVIPRTVLPKWLWRYAWEAAVWSHESSGFVQSKDLRLINHNQGNVMTKQLLTKLLTICLALTMLLGAAHGGIPGIK